MTTIQEFITKLSKLPSDMKVQLRGYNGGEDDYTEINFTMVNTDYPKPIHDIIEQEFGDILYGE